MFFPYVGTSYIFIYDYTQTSEEVLLDSLSKLMTEMVARGYTLEEIEYLVCLTKLDGK